MTQLSGLWTTDDTTPEGHQQASYTQAHASTMWEIAAACSGFEGVAPGYLNELACSTPGVNQVNVATGGAIVDGKWYKNDAVVALDADDLPSPSGGTTRIDRIVLRANWAAYTVTVVVIQGTESGGTPVAPSITQTSGTTYDIPLYQVLIDSGGNITLTDERTWAAGDDNSLTTGAVTLAKMAANSVDSDQYVDGSIDTVHIGDSQVTAAKIANRTRSFLAEITSAYNSDSAAEIQRGASSIGWPLSNTYLCRAFTNFRVPQDYVSGMTVQPIWWSNGGAGNIYYKTEARYGAVAEDYDAHSALGSYAALAVSVGVLQVGAALSLTDAAAGDIVSMHFYGDGSSGSWTYNGQIYITGILVSYTADS